MAMGRPRAGKETPPGGPRAWEACGRCVPSSCSPVWAKVSPSWSQVWVGASLVRAGLWPGSQHCRNVFLLVEQSSFEPGPYLGLR